MADRDSITRKVNKKYNEPNKSKKSKIARDKYEKVRAEEARKRHKQDEDKVRLFSRGKNFDFGLLLVVIVLLTVGLIMILSASSPFSLRTEGDSYFYFKKQLIFAGIGLGVMFIVSKLDYRMMNSRLSWLAYLGGLRIYGACYGARNWC